MAKKNKVRLVKSDTFEDNFVNVPTYLFPQGQEYSKEITPEMKVEEDNLISKDSEENEDCE